MAICERIYAAESAQLRRGDTHSATAFFVAEATAENLSDFHRIVGHLGMNDWHGMLNQTCFPIADTVLLRDRLIEELQAGEAL